MQRSPYRSRWSATVVLIAINVGCFLLQEINRAYIRFPVENYLYLSQEGLLKGYVWQLLTFQFLHGGVLHLAFNCLGLFMFGRFVEDVLGKAHFLKLYFLSGAIGGLFQSLLGLLWPDYFGTKVVGASAGVYGLMAAFTMIEPDGVLLAWFVLPIRAKYALMIFGGMELFYVVVPVERNLAHAAHLAGILGGLGYVHFIVRRRFNFLGLRPFRKPSPSRELVRTYSSKQPFWQKNKEVVEEELPPAEFISKQVDPILDKISAHGIQSLTARERQILEAARSRMGKR